MSENQPENHDETPEERRARRKNWTGKVYRNFNTDEADKRAYYKSLTSAQRLEIVFELVRQCGPPPPFDRTPRVTKYGPALEKDLAELDYLS